MVTEKVNIEVMIEEVATKIVPRVKVATVESGLLLRIPTYLLLAYWCRE